MAIALTIVAIALTSGKPISMEFAASLETVASVPHDLPIQDGALIQLATFPLFTPPHMRVVTHAIIPNHSPSCTNVSTVPDTSLLPPVRQP